MERALNPNLLDLALGQHDNLPSVAELSSLIAGAELSILIGNPQIDASLIEAAWYLHAIASSKYALRVYGLSRQRAAFRVAGHIFDLATKLPELSLIDKLKYCFCSQVAYLRSELNPNAIAAYNQEISANLPIVSLSSDPTLISLCHGVAFLGFDANYIYKTTKGILTEIRETVIALDVADIFALPCGAAAGVVTATRDLMTFLIYGNWGALDNARQVLQKAVLAEPSADDQISRWVAAHLLNLLTELEGSSIRSILPPDSPTSLMKAFVMGRPRVLTFWPPQIDLLKPSGTDDQSPLSPEVKRLFLSMPTSSGKTLIAQLIIASHLSTERTSVYYIAPTRSLCREVRVSLESRLRFLGREIVDGLPEGDWLGEFQTSEPRVEVMTPERLAYLLRSDSARVLTEVGLFVFDEVHNIGEQDRGWTLEQDLTYIHYATSGKSHRIILMSAAVGNQSHFVEWMENDGNMFMHRASEWRGPRQIHAIYTTTVDWNGFVARILNSCFERVVIQQP